MATSVTAPTTTQNALGFLGSLYQFGRRSQNILRLVGGLTVTQQGEILSVGPGWRQVANREFETNVDWTLPAPSQPARLERANAPSAITYQPSQAKNVIQIFHEAVDLSYLALSEVARMTDTGVLTYGGGEFNYWGDAARQIAAQMGKIAQDYNYSALMGTYANPANPTANALQMRGIRNAITTNVHDAAGAPLTDVLLAKLYRTMIENSGVAPTRDLIVLGNTQQIAKLSQIYKSEIQSSNRMIGGMMVREIWTAFGILNLPEPAYEMDLPQDELLFINPGVLQGTYLPMPGKPAMFIEQLAKVGSREEQQLYGQLSIDYGPEWAHAKLTNLEVEVVA